jgi:hypothetical protein
MLTMKPRGDDPYGPTITDMLTREFPGSNAGDAKSVMESVSREVVGTKQHRYGPMPDPESFVMIREVVSAAIAKQEPVKVLVPWGGSKQGEHGLDVAEMMGLKQLDCLDRRVRAYYAPGVKFVVRLEDLTDHVMFEDSPSWREKTEHYVAKMQMLACVMQFASVELKLESSIMDGKEHGELVRRNAEVVLRGMAEPAGYRGAAIRKEIPEWSGELPDDQLDFYRRAYDRFYPTDPAGAKDERLARYFGAAITRFQMDGTGITQQGPPYLTLSFTGIPWSKSGRRIFYRTVPQKYTNQHRAPWIGKGYVRIDGGTATPAIAGFDGDDLDYNPSQIRIQRQDRAVDMDADYVVFE